MAREHHKRHCSKFQQKVGQIGEQACVAEIAYDIRIELFAYIRFKVRIFGTFLAKSGKS